MAYDVEANIYTCATGNTITFDCIKKDKTQSDLEMETSVYNCKDCASCPLKEMCIWAYGSKSPLTERSTVIYVSKRFARQLSETEKRINTTAGKLIRVNRSFQAEGIFEIVKEGKGFRQFLLRSAVKVEVTWTLLSPVFSALKLYQKSKTAAWERVSWFQSGSWQVFG